ncbi:MAG: EcsC family protein [Propionibacteriaceae bacterium]|nr:EcsC family protein [Propionibacteriaceae bacterium]
MPKIGPIPDTVVGFVQDLALVKLPQAAGPMLTSAMVRLVDMAIDGVGVVPGAKRAAARHLQRTKDVSLAVDSVVRSHVLLATAQGIVTNIGGVVSALIGTPINATGIIVVQTRMVACIAHLHGYDIDDPRVRTAIVMCLLGERELERQITAEELPTTPLAVATSPVRDPGLHAHVADRVLGHILGESAGKGIVTTVGRKAPIIGGGVAGLADWVDTVIVARCARHHLVPRRLTTPITSYAWPGAERG